MLEARPTGSSALRLLEPFLSPLPPQADAADVATYELRMVRASPKAGQEQGGLGIDVDVSNRVAADLVAGRLLKGGRIA
jgi:hypothetical protein